MTDDQPKRGRPSDYSAQLAMSICDRLAEGENLRAICIDCHSIKLASSSGARELFTRRDTGQHCSTSFAAASRCRGRVPCRAPSAGERKFRFAP
jgi:hypothetical protein